MKNVNKEANGRIRILVLSILMFMICAGTSLEAKAKWDLDVVMVGIGAKNPTFDEGRFPDLQIVYTPGLVSQAQTGGTGKAALALLGSGVQEIFKGSPKILEEWWDKTDLRNHAILFDKNGVGSWEGNLGSGGAGDETSHFLGSIGYGKDRSLEKMMRVICRKGKTTKLKAKKEFKPKKDDPVLDRKMPDFDVVTVADETKPIRSLIENGRPTLVVFFQISPDADLQEAKESGKGKSGKQFMKAMVRGAAGSVWEQIFVSLEREIFSFDAREK